MPTESARDVVLPVGSFDDLGEMVEFAQFAEDLGYGYVSMGETSGYSVPLLLGHLAEHTEEIGITEDVLSPYSRTPSTLGQTAVTLQELSDNRFRLRLGASSPALAEKWHGVDFDRPLRRVREAIEIIRQVQSGERLDYDGEIFTPNTLKLECPPPEQPVPIDVAALGPKSTEMTGRFADGWVPQLLPFDGLRERLEDLRRGAELGDRSVDDVRVAIHLRSCVDEDPAVARNHARQQVAFLIAIYGPYYRRAVANAGYEDITDEVATRWADGDREGAVAAVTDELLDEVVAAGTPEQVTRQVERFEALDDVDAVQVAFFGGMDDAERRTTLETLAPQ